VSFATGDTSGANDAGRHRRLKNPLLWIVALAIVLPHSFLFAIFRYMIPIIPALLMPASIPMVKLITRTSPAPEDGR